MLELSFLLVWYTDSFIKADNRRWISASTTQKKKWISRVYSGIEMEPNKYPRIFGSCLLIVGPNVSKFTEECLTTEMLKFVRL